MAEGDVSIYQSFKVGILEGTFDLENDTIQALLVSGHVLDEDGDSVLADVSADEITDPSYSRQALGSLTVVASGTGTGTAVKAKWDAANVTFSSLTGTDPNYLILMADNLATDPLICAVELTKSTNGGDYIINWNANGIIRVS